MDSSPVFIFGYPTAVPTLPLSSRSHNTPTSRSYNFHNKQSPTSPCFLQHPLFMPPTPPITPGSNSPTTINPASTGSSRRPLPSLDNKTTPRPRPTPNPLFRPAEQRQQQKRDQFLHGVQARREERVFDGRGDRLLHLDYLNERRRWRHEQAICAPNFEPDDVDEDMGKSSQVAPTYPPQTTTTQPIDPTLSFAHTAPSSLDYSNEFLKSQHALQPLQQEQQITNIVDNAVLDDILTAEEQELEHLVQMHEAISSSAMEQDGDQQQRHTSANAIDMNGDMLAIPSSPTLWGSEDGDEGFEGELWRLVEGAGGGGEMMDES